MSCKHTHTVKDGEDLENIAVNKGFCWETIWDHPDNKELKSLRQDPAILLPGDEVHVPEIEKQSVGCGAASRHRFVRKGLVTLLRMTLKRSEKPRANLRFEFEIDGRLVEGHTDKDGVLEIPVPLDATSGLLRLFDGERTEERRIRVGGINPSTEVSGIQQRLQNLGFSCNQTEKLDEQTQSALRAFQEKYELDVTGELDDTTRAKIVAQHGN